MEYVGIHKKGELKLSELLKSIKEKADFYRAGAIATFVGVVRGETLDGEKVEELELQAYNEEANKVLSGICEDLKKREGLSMFRFIILLESSILAKILCMLRWLERIERTFSWF